MRGVCEPPAICDICTGHTSKPVRLTQIPAPLRTFFQKGDVNLENTPRQEAGLSPNWPTMNTAGIQTGTGQDSFQTSRGRVQIKPNQSATAADTNVARLKKNKNKTQIRFRVGHECPAEPPKRSDHGVESGVVCAPPSDVRGQLGLFWCSVTSPATTGTRLSAPRSTLPGRDVP